MDEPVESSPGPDTPPTVGTTAVAPPEPAPSDAPSDAPSAAPTALPTGAAVVLASLCAGAGIIHLVMAPIHASASGVEAAGFALAGWVQLGLAAHLLLRPTRAALTATVVANIAFLLTWGVSRTAGLPFGAHPGEAEAVGAVDLTTAVIEGAAVLLAGVALAKPRAIARIPKEGWAVLAGVPALTLLAVTLVVVSPATAQHQHAENASAAAPAPVRCDRGFNPRSYWTEATKAGLAVEAAAPAAMAGDGHGDGHGASAGAPPTTMPPDPLQGRGSAKLDAIVPKLSSESEADAAQVVMALPDLSDQEYEAFLYQLRKANAGHAAGHGASGDDTGGHGGHMGPSPWIPMTDQAQCDQLTRELGVARDTALRYPTAADAEAAGWRKVTPYVPGIAAHYMNFRLVDGRFEIDKPEMILYDGNGPDARVAGLSYYIRQAGEAEPTQGFTGDNDHYHRHIGLCIKDGQVIADSTTTPEQCAAQGGRKGAGGAAGWMSHAWVVPGCESPWGVFSGATPILDGQLAEQSGKNAGACAGSKARARYDLSPGTAPAPDAGAATESAGGR